MNFKIVENMSKRHDLVLCHLIRSGQYVADLNIPKILEMTDAISLNYKRIKENSEIRGYKATLYRIEQKRLEAYEKAIVTKFNYCSLISSVDRDYIYGDGVEPKNSVIVGNGVTYSDLPYQFVQSIAPNTTKRLIFIGVVTTVQNWDALYWFAKQVMPILLQQGDYRLDVVGRIDRDKEKILDIIPGIRVVGTVGSIPEATKGGLVGICPMRIGAGVQTKVLEYMSLGLPCVISSLALEGIEATPNQDVLVAKTPREYADAIIRLTEDRVYASRISTSARLVAEEKYSWRSRLQPLLESIDKLLQSGS